MAEKYTSSFSRTQHYYHQTIILATFLLTPLLSYAQVDLGKALQAIDGIRVEALEPNSNFAHRYLLWVEQPLDHNNPAAGTFEQRVILDTDPGKESVVFVTEGYSAEYAIKNKYQYELARFLHMNQIVVEHRFFKPSAPEGESLPWQYLTIENAAADHHRIISLLRPLLDGKWISTGISKGGQTAIFHRTLYPGDVDASVGYVCPLNFSDEDLRVYSFLRQVGSKECRDRIKQFQKLLLDNKDILLPIFIKKAEKEGLTYETGWEGAYEILTLEYAFAFWQWGTTDCQAIPDTLVKPKKIIDHLDSVAGLSWGSEQSINENPFFFQALTQLGMYGYDTTGFGGSLNALKDYTFRFACPDNYDCTYNGEMARRADQYLRYEANNFLFIYGENDPWSATAVQWSGNPGVRVFTLEDGSHRTRIGSFPKATQEEILNILQNWLNM